MALPPISKGVAPITSVVASQNPTLVPSRYRPTTDNFPGANFAKARSSHIRLGGKHCIACRDSKCARPNSSGTATSKHAGCAGGGIESSLRQIRISLSRQQHAAGDSGPARNCSERGIQERARRPIERRLPRSSVHADDQSSLSRFARLAKRTAGRCLEHDGLTRRGIALFGADPTAATSRTVLVSHPLARRELYSGP